MTINSALQRLPNDTLATAETVANITNQADQLTAADISVSAYVVYHLTDEAINTPEVSYVYSLITML